MIVQTGSNVTPDDLTSSTINNANLNVGDVLSITPNLVNEARFVFTRFVTNTADNTSAPGVIHPDGTQTGANFCCPQGGLQKRYQYIDNLTWSHGTAHHQKRVQHQLLSVEFALPAVPLRTVSAGQRQPALQFHSGVWPGRGHFQRQHLRRLPAGHMEDHQQADR